MGGVGNGGAEHLAYITITLSVYQSPDGIKKERKNTDRSFVACCSLRLLHRISVFSCPCFFAFVSVSVVVSANDSMKELMQKSLSLSLSLFCFLFFGRRRGGGRDLFFG